MHPGRGLDAAGIFVRKIVTLRQPAVNAPSTFVNRDWAELAIRALLQWHFFAKSTFARRHFGAKPALLCRSRCGLTCCAPRRGARG